MKHTLKIVVLQPLKTTWIKLDSDSHFEVPSMDQNIKQIFFHFRFFLQFCKKNPEKLRLYKWPFYDPFWPYFANYIIIFHETEIQTVILRF